MGENKKRLNAAVHAQEAVDDGERCKGRSTPRMTLNAAEDAQDPVEDIGEDAGRCGGHSRCCRGHRTLKSTLRMLQKTLDAAKNARCCRGHCTGQRTLNIGQDIR